MRKDLAKLTTEKERYGSHNSNKKYGGRVRVIHEEDHDYESERGGLHAVSRRRTYGWHCKEFSDVLNPIKGILRKNLGRPWNELYSEFSQVLDRRSNSGIHIFGHLMDFVKIHTYIGSDGEVCYGPAYGPREYREPETMVYGYYVDPVTGTLAYSGYNRYKRRGYTKSKPINEIELEDGSFYFKEENGFWYNGRRRKTEYGYGRKWDPTINRFVIGSGVSYDWIELKACNKKEIRYINLVLKERLNETTGNGSYFQNRDPRLSGSVNFQLLRLRQGS